MTTHDGSQIPRPRRIVAERRAQQHSAEGRVLQRMLRSLTELGAHRGCRRTRLGDALHDVLCVHAAYPTRPVPVYAQPPTTPSWPSQPIQLPMPVVPLRDIGVVPSAVAPNPPPPSHPPPRSSGLTTAGVAFVQPPPPAVSSLVDLTSPDVDGIPSVGAPIAAPPATYYAPPPYKDGTVFVDGTSADWANKTFVISQVRRRGSDLQFASQRLFGDIEVVSFAQIQDPASVQFAAVPCIEFLFDEAFAAGDKERALFLANLMPDTPRDSGDELLKGAQDIIDGKR